MEKEIMELTKEELLAPTCIPTILNSITPENESQILTQLISLGTKYKLKTSITNSIRAWKNDKRFSDNNVAKLLSYDEDGFVKQTTKNYQIIFDNDERYKNLFGYDTFSNRLVKFTPHGHELWTDADDAMIRCDIETDYGLYNQQKYYDAFTKVTRARSFNPVQDIIELKEWDGVPRIDKFLVTIMKCDDTDYTREVSRMIFYGGINRLYQPGCKFDYMPIFIGEQGTYKSTIVNWLAIHDDYFGDINTIEGKDALDNIQGRWICEFSELLALVRTKDVEAMKSFITRPIDKYRASYERRTQEYPRKCIFIGTTNDVQFLSDKTGNRRYLPIQIKLAPGELKNKEYEVRDYILNCWREAYYLFKNGKTYLTVPSEYYNDVLEAQESAIEDDPKMGLLLDYLEDKKVGEKVCTLEIHTNCFNELKKKFTRQDSKEISRMLSSLPDWERSNSTYRFETYGTQKYWEKIDISTKTKEPITENRWSDLD
jgi:predicted P-loop ATPase